jgi:transposase-like protein
MPRRQDAHKKTDWKAALINDPDMLKELLRIIMQEMLEGEMEETVGAAGGASTANLSRLFTQQPEPADCNPAT